MSGYHAHSMDDITEDTGRGYPGGLRILPEVLESVCKRMIRIILYSLDNATRGTIYTVGPIPSLRVVRIASGYKSSQSEEIVWDTPDCSEYDPPGKVWEQYCDRPGGILEAMAWCVEKQQGWTSDAPERDLRNTRKRSAGTLWEDYHHMQPVLVRKMDLWDSPPPLKAYPTDSQGKPIWQSSQYATVAVVKIHFAPGTIRNGDNFTRVIGELSESLGTEILSLHAKEVALQNQLRLIEERKETCDMLAHECRNIMIRAGFAYRAVNNEISYLRESWENLVSQQVPYLPSKKAVLKELNESLHNILAKADSSGTTSEASRLSQYQEQLMESCLLPAQNEYWLQHKIRPLWRSILSKLEVETKVRSEIGSLLDTLKESFHVSLDRKVIEQIDHLPDEVKYLWVELAYKEVGKYTNTLLKRYIELLDNSELGIPRQGYSRKNLICLKGLIEMIPQIETKLNKTLERLRSPHVHHFTIDNRQAVG